MSIDFPKRPPLPAEVQNKSVDITTLDERISLDQTSSTWIFEQEDREYHYDYTQDKWIEQSTTGKRPHDDDTNNNNSDANDEEELNKQDIKRHKKHEMTKLKQRLAELKQNSTKHDENAIFISNLPPTTTETDLVDHFSKYGLISQDFKSGKPRVKLYYNANGEFKREALVIYHSSKSVDMAIELADGGVLGDELEYKISVQRAEFNKEKKSSGGKDVDVDKKKQVNKARQRSEKKLTSWESDEEAEEGVKDYEERISGIKQKILKKVVVSLKGMFRKQEYHEDKYLEEDITQDIKDECKKLDIDQDIKTIQFDPEAEEIIIRFANANLSQKCLENFNNRFFDGLKISATLGH